MQKEMATHPSILGNIPWVFCNSHAMDILENPMDGGSWRATVHEVAKSQTRLSNSRFPFKEMCTHIRNTNWSLWEILDGFFQKIKGG